MECSGGLQDAELSKQNARKTESNRKENALAIVNAVEKIFPAEPTW